MRVTSKRRLRAESLEARTMLTTSTLEFGDLDESQRPEENTAAFSTVTGDSNGDGLFNQLDLVQVLVAGKFLTGDRATFSEGDWNSDGLFDQHDIVFAMQGGHYRQLHPISLSAHGKSGPIGGRPLTADLSGGEEVPGPGDPDGSGAASLTLNQGQGQICFQIDVDNIATPTAAHIHVGATGVAGGVVVNFDVANNGLAGCVDADKDIIKAVRQNPSNYYVNVHNADFPPGAVRGQLSK